MAHSSRGQGNRRPGPGKASFAEVVREAADPDKYLAWLNANGYADVAEWLTGGGSGAATGPAQETGGVPTCTGSSE